MSGKPDEKPSVEAKWSARLPILAAVAGIPVAILSGRPLSSLILIALATISLPFAVQRLSKLPNWPKFAHPKLMAVLSAAIVPAVVLSAILVPPTRNYVLYNILGFASQSAKPEAIQLEQGQTRASEAAFLVTLSNPGENERLVKRLSIRANNPGDPDAACMSSNRSVFVVGEQVEVTAARSSSGSKDVKFGTKVKSFSTDPSGKVLADSFVRRAEGAIEYESCANAAKIQLQFEVSLPLPPKQTTTFEFRFPQTFTVREVVSQDAPVVAVGEEFPISVTRWSSAYLELTLDKNELLTVCRDWSQSKPGDLDRC
jgi:hypothetical protein